MNLLINIGIFIFLMRVKILVVCRLARTASTIHKFGKQWNKVTDYE
jgi:hypothetical protein